MTGMFMVRIKPWELLSVLRDQTGNSVKDHFLPDLDAATDSGTDTAAHRKTELAASWLAKTETKQRAILSWALPCQGY